MEYIVSLIICIIIIFVLKFALNVKMKDTKKIKDIGYCKELNDITNKFPDNTAVCKRILKQLQNEEVKIKTSDDEKNKLTYYMVATNSIIIANINDTFTRIQTIAHECIHSIQNKKMLLFNFIFSNIYIIYFIVISVLTILKVIKHQSLQLFILAMLSFIYYIVRSYLETDAMTKAPYVAKQYMEESKMVDDKQIEKVMENYEELNKLGIPMTNFQLAVSVIIKIMIYCIICIIMNM